MAFKNYNVKDNAFSTLLVGISASATSMQVQAGDGAKFPPNNFIATLVQYQTSGDETSAVLKREKVLVTNNATDTFTITRGFDGDTPLSFSAGDFIYLNMVSEITEDMQAEIARLETDKLDTTTYNSTTRDSLTAYRLLYIDGTGNETQLPLGTAGQVLISQGTTSNPIWQAPTTDIAGLSEDTVGNMEADYIVKDNGTGNEKILVSKYRATNTEAINGTVTNKFITPKQAKDNYQFRKTNHYFTTSGTTAQTVTVTHGLGRVPRYIKMNTFTTSYNSGGTIYDALFGVWNGGTQFCKGVEYRASSPSGLYYSYKNGSIMFYRGNSELDTPKTASISNVTSTTFDINLSSSSDSINLGHILEIE